MQISASFQGVIVSQKHLSFSSTFVQSSNFILIPSKK